jgi:sigma-B regulation protein RsbU (phosphoserine phosphatase)
MACAFADADRLSQLVGNLVSNAVGYEDLSSAVTIESSVTQTGCSVSVTNFGTPIAQNAIDTLFKPMVRGDTAISAGRSIDLGLYIVREIAKAHGGNHGGIVRRTSRNGFQGALPAEDVTFSSPCWVVCATRRFPHGPGP